MNRYLHKFLSRAVFMAPLDDDQSTSGAGGAAVDRGDTLSAGAPTVDANAAAAEADAAAEAERIRAEQEAAAAAGAAGAEGDAAPDDAAGAKPGTIPLDRHKAVLDKARAERDALAAQLKQYQDGQQVARTNTDITKLEETVTAKEAEYNKALIDGEVEKATALMREIRAAERQIGDMKVEMRTQAATAQAIESVRYGEVVSRLEAAYPALNPDHESFDKEQVQDVMDLKATYERRGATPSAALQKAVEKLMPAATAKQEAATTVTPRVDKAEVAAAARKEEAVKKGLDAAGKTPPNAAKVGADSDKHGGGEISAEKVMKMSQDQFAKLNEADLARLRGDDLV
jgi:hypothetical protein